MRKRPHNTNHTTSTSVKPQRHLLPLQPHFSHPPPLNLHAIPTSTLSLSLFYIQTYKPPLSPLSAPKQLSTPLRRPLTPMAFVVCVGCHSYRPSASSNVFTVEGNAHQCTQDGHTQTSLTAFSSSPSLTLSIGSLATKKSSYGTPAVTPWGGR